MAFDRAEVVIVPSAEVEVTITRDDGAGFSAFKQAAGGAAVEWPDVIDERTSYYFDSPAGPGSTSAFGAYHLSALLGDLEVAGSNGQTQPFSVGGGAPVTLEVGVDPVEDLQARIPEAP